MRPIFLSRWIVSSLLAISMVGPALGGEATDQIRETTDKAIAVLTEPSLQGPSKADERKKLLSKIADERFDWEEMARRALARHWAGRTEEEKREFVSLFRQLLERTYLDKVDNYSGEKVIYEGESLDGDFGVVRAKAVTNRGEEIPVEYRVRKKGKNWLVYDISIQGVSLVNNYRTQFNSIIVSSSYKNLIRRLKAKLDED
ncbi:MAG: ABC transporter substrate-binding protein [Deltaproteobacteria bacterium]|nr:ABC transporter substrate-binding protein [Deltaproteobacteria bacterium]MBW2120436.1 ABC transporter substrate-binding protein [Deltaproteobacteria bacterium]